MSSRSVYVVCETTETLPRISWESIFYSAKKIMKKLSPLVIVFVSAEKSRKLNAQYRKKSAPANVLTFSQNREIVIAPSVVRKEAKMFGFSYKYWMTSLIVHGIVHLEGYDHVRREERRAMENIEKKILDECV
jgi:probable rRNA maturation factor